MPRDSVCCAQVHALQGADSTVRTAVVGALVCQLETLDPPCCAMAAEAAVGCLGSDVGDARAAALDIIGQAGPGLSASWAAEDGRCLLDVVTSMAGDADWQVGSNAPHWQCNGSDLAVCTGAASR